MIRVLELQENLGPLDLLWAAGLANYFGKVDNIEDIRLSPILINKGGTKVALYGLGSVRDERLMHAFKKDRVRQFIGFASLFLLTHSYVFLIFLRSHYCVRSKTSTTGLTSFVSIRTGKGSYFTFFKFVKLNHMNYFSCFLFVFLSFLFNSARHGPDNFVPETVLPNFLDLVLWYERINTIYLACLRLLHIPRGHEHENRLAPEFNDAKDFSVCQPGSSIATSLSPGEEKQKYFILIVSQFDIDCIADWFFRSCSELFVFCLSERLDC